MKYLYLWFFTTCVLPWSPWFGDKPKPVTIEPTPPIVREYLCDCGWRNVVMWHDVTVSPFTKQIQNQPF